MTEKYSYCSIIQHLINARCTRHAESPQLATQLRLLAICGRCSRGSAADVSSSSCRHCSRLFPGRFVVAFQIFAAVVVFGYKNFVYKFVFVFFFVHFSFCFCLVCAAFLAQQVQGNYIFLLNECSLVGFGADVGEWGVVTRADRIQVCTETTQT